ncbi:MAG: hypothetical protein LAT83_20360 [Kiritimatiellae bacterium]|nr:hypothetical protein [Kiritimatiellia bacterium]
MTFDTLAKYCEKRKLIWASTTPVWTKSEEKTLDAKTDRVRERNRIAADLASDRNIVVNDLFSHVVDRPELFSADGTHFVESGQVKLAKHVTNAILSRENIGTEQSPAGDSPKAAPEE